jgi:hypothetical protein
MEACLVSILWSVNGIYSFLMRPNGQRTTYITVFFADIVMPFLIENVWPRIRRKMLKD